MSNLHMRINIVNIICTFELDMKVCGGKNVKENLGAECGCNK